MLQIQAFNQFSLENFLQYLYLYYTISLMEKSAQECFNEHVIF